MITKLFSDIERYPEPWWIGDIIRWQNGQWVDTDKYNIVEKPEYRQKLIDNKEAEIKQLDQLHQERKDRLLKELKELKNKRELNP